MKKKLITLAKGLDFTNGFEYFDYLIDSHYNGQFSQCKELFNAMRKDDQKHFLNYANVEFHNTPEIYNFYFNLL